MKRKNNESIISKGNDQPLADIAACRHLAAQAVEWMLMHHAPFGAQQATAVGLAHAIEGTVFIANLPLLRRQARGDRLQQRGLPGAGVSSANRLPSRPRKGERRKTLL